MYLFTFGENENQNSEAQHLSVIHVRWFFDDILSLRGINIYFYAMLL